MAQSMLFFLAGYETTATTLSFAAYSLATNPECQCRLLQEIDTLTEKQVDFVSFIRLSKIVHFISLSIFLKLDWLWGKKSGKFASHDQRFQGGPECVWRYSTLVHKTLSWKRRSCLFYCRQRSR